MALQRDPGRANRPRLSRPTIVSVALGVARADGLAAVSMRRIADELDCAPMSLYRHVTDRDDLLSAMLDEIAAGIDVPRPADDPRSDVRLLVTAVHDVLARDPWMVQALVVEQLASPLILPVVERIFAALRAADKSPREAVDAYGLLFQFVYGDVLNRHHDRGNASVGRRIVRDADPDLYPTVAEILRDVPGPAQPDFARNLQHVLDGIFGR